MMNVEAEAVTEPEAVTSVFVRRVKGPKGRRGLSQWMS